ncbi:MULTISPECIES: hypothetical protein [Pseudomonas]|uniref:hypothetical protein n=1 Tax=Pseudomonas TaxID=286 RepID=UPI0015D4F26C|nr:MULTISPECIES: hypothetical protein [Pseudomonas]MBM9950758.1 hypothetical protein [Pseudomonas aeruginosa]MBM9974598.1 hypothetical protein [Pseudomonas aeruginosa]MBN0995787.1 hypothetical protein [Pseudomonas aeruginosa]MCE0753286.1 hypothetical protein [Pseudomonas asiatica]MCE0864861.1 hypothetical protein [Pseudomonas alloputida]
MTTKTLREALNHYREKVSILKKGYKQECYRIQQIANSLLGEKIVREITSVDMALLQIVGGDKLIIPFC